MQAGDFGADVRGEFCDFEVRGGGEGEEVGF